MKPVQPIFLVDLLPVLDERLLAFLRELGPGDWNRPTVVNGWSVRDVAAHLVDGNIRGLSGGRDGFFGEKPERGEDYADLVVFLNRLNAEWTTAFRRVSHPVLIELLELTGRQYCEYLKSLDPLAPAMFAVAWAGDSESPNWFHIAREYTEKWHHQQQIRLAVGDDRTLLAPGLYLPYLDTSLRGLPHRYRDVQAGDDSVIRVEVGGVPGAVWFLHRKDKDWRLLTECDLSPVCEVTIKGDAAWKIFTKALDAKSAAGNMSIRGRAELGQPVAEFRAVMV